MSFFADMIAGGLAGAGKGMSDYAVMQEREDEKRAQLEAQMQLKREMLADQLANKRDIAEMRWGDGGSGAGGRGSGGKGGSGLNLFQMMMDASTPAEQDKVVKLASMLDKNAGAAMADQFYGRPIQEQVATQAPTTGDLVRFDRGEQSSIPELTTSSRSVSYDKQKGALALQRMYTLVLDPSKTDDLAKAEGQNLRNDAVTSEINQGMNGGMPLSDALDQSLPRLKEGYDPTRSDIQQQRIDETSARTRAMIENGSANRTSREATAKINAALKELQLAQAAEKDATGKNRAERAANTKAALDKLAALSKQEVPVSDVNETPAPGAFVYTPRKPSAAAAAFRNGK